LAAALSEAQQPPLLPIQVARQLGYENKRYLQTYFPELCHQLVQRYEAHRRQVARVQLEKVIAEPGPEPPTLATISRQLGYHLNSLKYLCPDLCQIIEDRYQTYHQQKKQAVGVLAQYHPTLLPGTKPGGDGQIQSLCSRAR
jgi:hypothetical protein